MNKVLKIKEKEESKMNVSDDSKEIIQIIMDFLLILKDIHPFADSKRAEFFTVFNNVMQFMYGNELKPSDKLYQEYQNSSVTRNMVLPSYDAIGDYMSLECYEKLRNFYNSKPTFVYLFNPKFDFQSKDFDNYPNHYYHAGYFSGSNELESGAGLRIYPDGLMYQGYYDSGRKVIYGRQFYANGDFYEGGFGFMKKQGKGEFIYADGTRLVGTWNDDKKQGRFECYENNDGNMTVKEFNEDEEVAA